MTDRRYQQRFETLLHQHQGIVLKVAGAYARDKEERNDLAQEICTQLWRAFPNFDERLGRFSTWMYRIALNVAISQRRRGLGARVYFEPLEARHLDSIGGHVIEEPDERLAALYLFIGRLDPLNRALILLYLEDRSYAEIADVLGISETNVATKISRAKQKLREQAAQMSLSEEI